MLLLTGICGFVGSTLARAFKEHFENITIVGVDNLTRRGAFHNIAPLEKLGVKVIHGDLRCQSDVEALPDFDWLIDAAANPSVLAGADGKTSSRQLMEHNLLGTLNLLERCKQLNAGFILLSTSRVYSIAPLASLPVKIVDNAYQPDENQPLPAGISRKGIAEPFSTTPPVSLYGISKLASEALALEYSEAFRFPVWINRCGVLAGAGQFGRADQGIFSYWIHSHLRNRPLKYIGFDGEGHQVRDCLHPKDLVPLLLRQMQENDPTTTKPKLINVSGGIESATSLRQLTQWCDARFEKRSIASDPVPRPYDLPWVVLDSSLAQSAWDWHPTTTVDTILAEIAEHAEKNPDWLTISS
jgi:CDP-paratose 2-epimerase